MYADFLTYTGGVYKHTTGSLLGGHAVKFVGWGTEGGEDYWLVANSWNPHWGLDGKCYACTPPHTYTHTIIIVIVAFHFYT